MRNDLSVITIRLAKLYVRRRLWASKYTFFCYLAASCILYENLRTIYCCRRYKFPIRHCCATRIIFMYSTLTYNSVTHRIYCCLHCNSGYANATEYCVTHKLPLLTEVTKCVRGSHFKSKKIITLVKLVGDKVTHYQTLGLATYFKLS
jgi:hypothetical protein